MQKLKQNREEEKNYKMRQRVSAMHLTEESVCNFYIIFSIYIFSYSRRVIFDVLNIYVLHNIWCRYNSHQHNSTSYVKLFHFMMIWINSRIIWKCEPKSAWTGWMKLRECIQNYGLFCCAFCVFFFFFLHPMRPFRVMWKRNFLFIIIVY